MELDYKGRCEGCGDADCTNKQSDCDGERCSDIDICTCYNCDSIFDNDDGGEWVSNDAFMCDDCIESGIEN